MTRKRAMRSVVGWVLAGLLAWALPSGLVAPYGGTAAGLALAQEPPAPGTAPGSAPSAAPSPYLEDTRPHKALSLQEALQAAIANNLDVAIKQKNPESARYGVIERAAVFDPLLSSTVSYQNSKSEPQSAFQLSTRKTRSGEVSLQQVLEQGFSYKASWNTSRSRGSSLINPLPATVDAGLSLLVSQPLLRGFGLQTNRTDIEIARLDLSISEEDFRSTVIDTMRQVEFAYWDLSAAISSFAVAQESLKLAQDLLALNRKKVEVGTLAPIQITEAEASVATRENDVINAEAAVRFSEDRLRRIMNVPPDSGEWETAIVPSDKPSFKPATIDHEEMIRTALAKRPEIEQAKQGTRKVELQYRLAQNARKPQLDAFARYAPSGNNFDTKDVIVGVDRDHDGTVDRNAGGNKILDTAKQTVLVHYNDTVREVFGTGKNYDWSIGLNFSLPLGNRAATAGEAQTRIAYEQSQMSLENLQRNIQVEVRVAVRAVETGVKRVSAARSTIVLQEKKLEAEQKRYENGMSTSFQVLTFQNDLTSARNAEIDAITAYNKAVAELGRATATLPERRGVTIARP